ncbi:FtsB family cell division protein [Microbacterium sp.]|uniref:FtsB family cell division protein n=1 Tax=Microbacterium sp. TaxID=51671 RepID=UPI0039E4D148
MGTTTAPPSRARRRVDVRAWLGGIRLSGFTLIMLGLVILAAFVLVPTVGTYLDQRAQIAALEQSVKVTADEVAALEAERDRWSDPAYITTQARERLYYTLPGEVVYLIDDDLPAGSVPEGTDAVSADLEETRTDWMAQLVRSVTSAGLAKTVTGTPAP